MFYLTCARSAPAAQVRRAYPGFDEFLVRKKAHDPRAVLQSTWHRHYERLMNGAR